jgi:hypothetical protein
MKRTEDFRLTGVVWHEAGFRPIDMTNFLEKTLNKSLKIKDYGVVLDYLFFVFIIHLPTQIIHKEFRRVSRKKHEAVIYAKTDYEKFVQSNDREAFLMLCETFLSHLKEMCKRKDKDFDWNKLFADAEKLIKNLENEELRFS